jgi:hypothetical protein
VTPKFVAAPAYPDLTIVGSANGPRSIPLAQMKIGENVLAYETLFSFDNAATGEPMAAAYPGTYGPYLMAAGRRM